jgi:hypothetical protein
MPAVLERLFNSAFKGALLVLADLHQAVSWWKSHKTFHLD